VNEWRLRLNPRPTQRRNRGRRSHLKEQLGCKCRLELLDLLAELGLWEGQPVLTESMLRTQLLLALHHAEAHRSHAVHLPITQTHSRRNHMAKQNHTEVGFVRMQSDALREGSHTVGNGTMIRSPSAAIHSPSSSGRRTMPPPVASGSPSDEACAGSMPSSGEACAGSAAV